MYNLSGDFLVTRRLFKCVIIEFQKSSRKRTALKFYVVPYEKSNIVGFYAETETAFT